MTPIEKLQQADHLLAQWLTDNTESIFEEQSEVDEARCLVQDAIDELTASAQEQVIDCAKRLVEHADFKLGGALSADSKARDIPSNAVSMVKSRHLAALRDALAAPPTPAQVPVIQPWMKPDPRCDWSCMYGCTEGFTKSPDCVTAKQAPAQTWIGLTDEEFVELCSADLGTAALIRAVESKLKEKDYERSQRASDQDD